MINVLTASKPLAMIYWKRGSFYTYPVSFGDIMHALQVTLCVLLLGYHRFILRPWFITSVSPMSPIVHCSPQLILRAVPAFMLGLVAHADTMTPKKKTPFYFLDVTMIFRPPLITNSSVTNVCYNIAVSALTPTVKIRLHRDPSQNQLGKLIMNFRRNLTLLIAVTSHCTH